MDTLWWTNIAIENGHLQWIFPLNMVIFHSKMLVHQRVDDLCDVPFCQVVAEIWLDDALH